MATLAMELDFELKWRLGARSTFLIWETAKPFASEIHLLCGGLRANAKNILSVMMLGGVRPKLVDGSCNFGPDAGTPMKLLVHGPDAEAAFAKLSDLFTCGERVVQCRNQDCISSAILVNFSPRGLFYSCSKFHMWIVDRKSGHALSPSPRELGIRR